MEENHRSSMKLDIEAVRLSDVEQVLPKETYKPIPEYPADVPNNHHAEAFDGAAVKNSNMVRENNDHIEDGAGDAMLGEKEQLAINNEVKFISAEHKNGDAKIDIGNLEKAFTGMTKEELMRYANDPFWVRLRWIFFILFWGLWIAMLGGAILIIIGAPKCAAPVALPWYKQGPLVRLSSSDAAPSHAELLRLKAVGARGAIFTLPANETYLVGTAEGATIDARLKAIVAALLTQNIQPIADVTPNFVGKDDALFKEAIESEAARSAFVFATHPVLPNNWLSKVNGSAWHKYQSEHFVLSQFGADRFDLQLNSTLAKDKFKAVLAALAGLGVRGVRLHNAKHFIISDDLRDEKPAAVPESGHTEYGHYLHTQTTYQAGLGKLLGEFAAVVRNATGGEGFLSLAENIGRPEAFHGLDGRLAVELPIVGVLPHTLASGQAEGKAKQLLNELTRAVLSVGNTSWVQWEYDEAELAKGEVGLSEYNAFVMLLPGVPVAGVKQFELNASPVVAVSEVGVNATMAVPVLEEATNATTTTTVAPVVVGGQSLLAELEALRQTPSYMHGSFDVYIDASQAVIAYTRIKSGNPGYFVAYNPTAALVHANFSNATGLPEQLTVQLFSSNYKVKGIVEKGKVQSAAIPIDARSVVILTYVPKSAE